MLFVFSKLLEMSSLQLEYQFYFGENVIGTLLPGQQQRRTPRFPIALWNINERVVNNLPTTNNHVEGWHNNYFDLYDIHFDLYLYHLLESN